MHSADFRRSFAIFLTLLSSSLSQNEVDNSTEVESEDVCLYQLRLLLTDPLLFSFLDASARLPSGIQTGNINDLGNYHQCLAIHEEVQDTLIEGKYCTILVPGPQNNEEDSSTLGRNKYYSMQSNLKTIMGVNSYQESETVENDPQLRVAPIVVMAQNGVTLAMCIPRACSPRQAIDALLPLLTLGNIEYSEYYCRVPNDKPWHAADYVAMVVFGIIFLLCIASTAYDLHHVFIAKKDPKKANVLYRCFSVYTNTSRLLTFNKSPGSLDCLDGIRAISMLWVIVGHTFTVTNLSYVQNLAYVAEWLEDFWSLWITSAPITVDTFFVLSGILVVYSIISKITRVRFIQTLHLYVANRLLRMFPLLAAVVLLQASFFNHIADGPYWESVAVSVERCRTYWWSALLHVQNYVNPFEICLGHTWYVSVDTQLYLIAPVVMVFLFGRKRVAASVLALAVVTSLTICAVYSFKYNFPSALVTFGRFLDFNDYMTSYYINTITRSPPFFIGMVYGYILHIWRNEKIRIPKYIVWSCWVLSFALMAVVFFSTYPVIQSDHDNQLVDNLLNTFIRSIWAVALGWLILACIHGYGGPINWLLSLSMWKLPARMSYAMFLLHFPLQIVVNGTWTQTKYFTVGDAFYRYLSDVMMTMLAAFVLSLAIDSPFSTLQKLLMNGGGRQRKSKPTSNGVSSHQEVKGEIPNGNIMPTTDA